MRLGRSCGQGAGCARSAGSHAPGRARYRGVRPAGQQRTWKLLGADGKQFESPMPGTLGGHRRTKIYGRLDCPSALRAIARGGYVGNRVFFVDAQAALAAGYRPCTICLHDAYEEWEKPDASSADARERSRTATATNWEAPCRHSRAAVRRAAHDPEAGCAGSDTGTAGGFLAVRRITAKSMSAASTAPPSVTATIAAALQPSGAIVPADAR
ncbi:MAG: hypothetical protein KGL16_03120 [Acidobacteriota bacterium]|nr:hypothetical protein [Acidobacteriota bacterium]